jgi:hypothetical protein
MGIFRRGYEVNPFPVHDIVTFRNGEGALRLEVKADASVLVSNLSKAQKRLSAIGDDTEEEEQKSVAKFFAAVIFGDDQAERLMDFYGEPLTVITVCGKYFQDRLGKIITKAQKRK